MCDDHTVSGTIQTMMESDDYKVFVRIAESLETLAKLKALEILTIVNPAERSEPLADAIKNIMNGDDEE